jgi:hypothetical protein
MTQSKLPSIDTQGIGALIRDLRKIDKDLASSLVKELRSIGNTARDEVRGSTAYPFRTGGLRRSVKTGVRRGTIVLFSRLPQSGVIEWGGKIKPRGVPIEFKRSEFVTDAVEANSAGAEERLGVVLESTAARHGFH